HHLTRAGFAEKWPPKTPAETRRGYRTERQNVPDGETYRSASEEIPFRPRHAWGAATMDTGKHLFCESRREPSWPGSATSYLAAVPSARPVAACRATSSRKGQALV